MSDAVPEKGPQTPPEGGKAKKREIPSERLEEVRERLYARGELPMRRGRSGFARHKDTPVREVWKEGAAGTVINESVERTTAPTVTSTPLQSSMRSGRQKMRTTVAFGALIFFALAIVLSGAFLIFGKNSISGSNIEIEVKGPFAVGGGEEMPLTITIKNDNAVPIEHATLIIEYPLGTQSATDKGKELFRDRRSIDRLNPGEVLNVQANAIVFGEENEEKEIRVQVEYRVEKSNATFFKDAEPLRFKINSSPVTLSVDAVKLIASGQEAEFKIKVHSNSPTPLSDLLVTAEYPDAFDFSLSEPQAASGNNAWIISDLKPEEEKEITVRGLMTGQTTDVRVFTFKVGVPNERDRFEMASLFTTKTHEIEIEQAFVSLAMKINGRSDANPVVGIGDPVTVEIQFTNTLRDTIYDASIETVLSGNALNKSKVSPGVGYYNSSQGTIVWDGENSGDLREIAPGAQKSVTFTVTPTVTTGSSRTPQVSFSVNVKGKRVRENAVTQGLTGTVSKTVRVESSTSVSAQALYSIGPFKNTGPMPPVAEEVTQYTVLFTVANGSNSVTDAVVEAVLPPYVTWLDMKNTTSGSFTYNASSRTVTWKAGSLDAEANVSGAFQVSLLPSTSQVGSMPALVTDTRLRATDRFTGTVLRSSAPDVSTRLDGDPDEDAQDGRVQKN